jgi:hypothetical protein
MSIVVRCRRCGENKTLSGAAAQAWVTALDHGFDALSDRIARLQGEMAEARHMPSLLASIEREYAGTSGAARLVAAGALQQAHGGVYDRALAARRAAEAGGGK